MKQHKREAAELELPNTQEGLRLRSWWAALRAASIGAHRSPQTAFQRARHMREAGARLEALAGTGGVVTLDLKLARASRKGTSGALAHSIDSAQDSVRPAARWCPTGRHS